ncbi:hypothetical protein FRB99_000154 [Tulasnella sp. 403]|nr:hypothetical protein FRB99_000154 [Tulasnella sp. 403]
MVPKWGAGNAYKVGDVVRYKGWYYKCIQAHTSQNDWTPDVTPALWGRQGRVGEGFSSEGDYEEFKVAHEEVEKAGHKAELSHEILAGAATFAAMEGWEHHKAKNGDPSEHPHAKAAGAALIGAFVDRMVETKGLDFIDKQKAKKEAEKRFEGQLESNYR